MEYIIIILIILYGIIIYDLRNINCLSNKIQYSITKNEIKYYYIIFCILTTLSGLSFKVGTDVPIYMIEFNSVSWKDFESIEFGLSRKQPLWLLLQLICKSIANHFSFLKIVIATIVNITLCKFILKNSKLLFTSLLLYFLILFFDVNFNILRQSLSLCCFLICYNYLITKNYLKSYIFIFLAILFHNSAIFLLIIPLLVIIPFEKKITISYLIIAFFSVLFLFIPKDSVIFIIFLSSPDDNLSTLSNAYLNNGDYGESTFSLLTIIIKLLIYYFVVNYYSKSKASRVPLAILFCYIFCEIAANSIPIVSRIKIYFTPIYIIAICNSIYYIFNHYKFKSIKEKQFIFALIVSLFLMTPIKSYFIYNPRLVSYNIYQYYPYHSIFNPVTERNREKLIDYK